VESEEQVKWLGQHFGILPAKPAKASLAATGSGKKGKVAKGGGYTAKSKDVYSCGSVRSKDCIHFGNKHESI
jgi:hypothetical protein